MKPRKHRLLFMAASLAEARTASQSAFNAGDGFADVAMRTPTLHRCDLTSCSTAMARHIFFVTGTDTGVGKTVFAAVLTQTLRERGMQVAALKPICSGGRDDARRLREAMGESLSLDEVNPWHFRAPLSPLLAARMERRRVSQAQVVAHVRAVAGRFDLVVVEGAGGLLSPLGEDFDSRDLIIALQATPVLVCPNRLGAVNQVLLTLEALPRAVAKRTQIVLMNPPHPDSASRTNLKLLAKFVSAARIHTLNWLGGNPFSAIAAKQPAVCKAIGQFVRAIAPDDPIR
jgi:dethiobiotin synthetase